MTKTIDMTALAEPFPPNRLGWKPGAVRDNRALAMAYIDARDVMERLDAVVGPALWSDSYSSYADGCVTCKLTVCGVTKEDIGDPSDQKESGNRHKAAFSDALKRAAVKFGIGRYLYGLETVWVGYDAKARVITEPPKLPRWAIPRLTTRSIAATENSLGLSSSDATMPLGIYPGLVDVVHTYAHILASSTSKFTAGDVIAKIVRESKADSLETISMTAWEGIRGRIISSI